MFDQRDRRTKFIIHIEDEARHVFLFLDIHSRHRLIKQQQGWLGSQCAAQLNPLLQTIGQTAHRRFADRLDFQKIDDPLGKCAVFGFFPLRTAKPHRLRQHACFHMCQPACHNIVQRRHAVKQGDVLKGAGDALRRNLMRAHRAADGTLVPDLTILRMIEPVDHIQHG